MKNMPRFVIIFNIPHTYTFLIKYITDKYKCPKKQYKRTIKEN